MKKAFFALGSVGMSVAAFADGTSSVTVPDISGVTSAVTTWAGTFGTTLVSIAGAFLAWYLLKLALRALKGVAGSAK